MNSIPRLAAALLLLLSLAGAGGGEKASPRAPEALWADLATDDPAKAHHAMTDLTAQPEQTVSFLAGRLRPIPVPDPRRLAQLIAELDHPRFAVRDRATGELERLGEPAEPALHKALAERLSAEARRRLEQVLTNNKKLRLHPGPEQRRLERAIEVLETIGSPPARRLLKALADGAPDAPLTRDAQGALERLADRKGRRR
jgi:hypothetical protein